MPQPYADDSTRLAAIRARDPAADGHFFFSVSTTGVFCHPSCAARPARPEHIAFHATQADARRAGFRPCLRCRPDLAPRTEREAGLVAAACRAIEAAELPPALADLARGAGLSPSHFHRLFRRVAGVTPRAYADATRQARLQQALPGSRTVTEAIYGAGFNTAGRFYDRAAPLLGMHARHYRAGAPGETICRATRLCRLGIVLVAATGRGICAILLGDDAAALEADLRARFPRATLAPAGADFESLLGAVLALIDDPRAGHSLPLDIRGTAFQRRVWERLQATLPGETLTYGQLAASLGQPTAARAAAAACAANALAVAIPCHRILAADGALTGYRWGLVRKRALLDRELTPTHPGPTGRACKPTPSAA